jgi:hypothetical protein
MKKCLGFLTGLFMWAGIAQSQTLRLPAWQRPLIPPTVTVLPAGFDSFSIIFGTEPPAANAPQIAEWTRTAGPDESIVLTGETLTSFTGLSAGKDTRFVTQGRDGVPHEAQILRLDGQKAAVTLPVKLPAWSFYFLWAKNQNGFSRPIAINRADAWWVGPKDVARGSTVSVHGRNLAHDNGTAQSWVYIEPATGGTGQWATVSAMNPYRVSFTVPTSLTNGNYTVWVHNGHGGQYGWSDPVPMTVFDDVTFDDAAVLNILDYGAIANDNLDDSQAVQAAMRAAENSPTHKTVYIPAGTFIFTTSVYPGSGIRLKGAGKNLTILKCSDTYSADSYGMMLTNGLANYTIQDLTFDANRTMKGWIGSVLYLRFCYNLRLINVKINALGYDPVDFHGCDRVFLTNCDLIGKINFGGTSNEVYIDGTNFYLTNDIQGSLFFWGSTGVSITNSTCQDFDNSNPDSGDGWGEGRFVAISDNWGINQNYYMANNTTTDLTVRPAWWNQNAGEQILWEGGNVDFRGSPVGSATATATFSTTALPQPGRVAVITKGTGYGQIRTISAVAGTTITVDKPWNVQPDATSQIDIGKFNNHFVIYKNYLDAKARAATNTDHIASAAIQPYGGTTNLIVDGNTAHQTRAFLPNWTLSNALNAGHLMQPDFFNLFVNNQIQNNRYGYVPIAGWPESAPAPKETPFVGNILRGNTFQNMLEAPISFQTTGSGVPAVEMSIYERNTATNTPTGVGEGGFIASNQIYRKNNFSAGSPVSLTSVAIGPNPTSALRENTWTGYATTYANTDEDLDAHIEAPYHVLELTAQAGAAAFDTLFRIWNAGKVPLNITLAEGVTWLTPVQNATGTIATENDTQLVKLRVSPIVLPAGVYAANLTVTAGFSKAVYSVNLTVGGKLPKLISVKNGSWHDPATWNIARVPTPADSVIIDQPHSVTVGVGAQAKHVLQRAKSGLVFSSPLASLSLGFPVVTTDPESATTTSSVAVTTTLFGNSTPIIGDYNDPLSVELGVKFKSDISGEIKAVRFYRRVGSSNGYTVHLWKANGTLLATATVPVDPNLVPGWQQIYLQTPVNISANETYIASYLAPSGQYAFAVDGLSAAITKRNLTALAGLTNGGNGVYIYGNGGGFPTNTYRNTNYFVDVLFVGTP